MASLKALNIARSQANSTIASVLVYCQTNSWRVTWSMIQTKFGIVIPEPFVSKPCDYTNVKYGWGTWYLSSVEARLEDELKGDDSLFSNKEKANVYRIYELPKTRTRWKAAGHPEETSYLAPEQDAVYLALIRDYFNNPQSSISAAYNDGTMGAGKTVLGAAIIKYIIENQLIQKSKWLYAFAPIIIVTRKGVMESWSRHLELAGLGKYLGNTIVVTSYAAFTSSYGKMFLREEPDPTDPKGERTRYKWNVGVIPFFILFDEAHSLNRDSKQTRAFLSLADINNPLAPVRSLWLSATPFTTVDNTRAFAIFTKTTLLGMRVTQSNFNQFAKLISDDPSHASEADASKIRKIFGPYIYSFPRVKWAHKAINSIKLVEFSSEQDRQVYQAAYDRFLEKCRKLGKNTEFGRFEKHIAIGQYRLATEPLRMDQIVDLCHDHITKGIASPVIGCAYRNSVIRAVFRLINLGYKRQDISIIWGGKDEIKSTLVLDKDGMDALIRKSCSGEELTKSDLRKIQETLRFREDKISYGEATDDITRARHQKLTEFGLMGSQSENARQVEIDRFQTGQSKICIFTLAAGGIGLSLDHCRSDLLPRIGYFTPTYSGPEFKQALGRLPRRFTLSDTYQYIVGMVGTIEESHVLPAIDLKLRCLAKVTNADYDIINTIATAEVLERVNLGTIRDEKTAIAESDNEDTQIQSIGESDKEDTEEDEDENA